MRRGNINATTAFEPGRREPPTFMFEPVRRAAFGALTGPGGLSRKAVIVTAPVGFGKTVLMSQIHGALRKDGHDSLWLALDERDQTIEGLIAALTDALPSGPRRVHPTEALFSGEPISKRIERCLAPLTTPRPSLTLFIDNLSCCDDPALPYLLNRLLFATGPGVHLVLGGNVPLPADLARARMEGLATEIGPADLGFGRTEIALVLGADLCQRIGARGIDAILDRTEGWPAAVRLSAIMLADAPDPASALASLSGSDENIADLLNNRVLSGFDAEAREFLLCLGQLRRFSLDLCRAAIGEAAAETVLTGLIARNMLIIPLDRERQWYRLHGLFRDHLLREGERALTLARRRDINARAAAWCVARGHGRGAVDYGFAADDLDLVERVMEGHAAAFVRNRGDILPFIRGMERLRGHGRGETPEASYWYAWALALCRRYEDSRHHCDRLAARLGERESRGRESRGRDDLTRRLTMLRVSLDSITDQMRDAHDGATRWLAGAAPGSDPFDGTAAHCIVGYHHIAVFDFAGARRALLAAREAAFQSGSAYVEGWAAAYSALVSLCEGRFDLAHAELGAALGAARAALGDDGGITGTLALMLAKCALELGRDDEARRWLAFGLPTSRTHGFLESAACGLEAAVKLGQGTAETGSLSHATLADVATAYPPRLSDMLSCFIVRRLIERGEIEAAAEAAERAGLSGNGRIAGRMSEVWAEPALMRDLIRTTETELMIAGGRLSQASIRVEADLRRARLEGRMARAVELALARCAITARLHHKDQTLRSLTLAIRLAAPGGFIRPFRVQARTIEYCIQQTSLADWAFPAREERLFFAEICKGLPGPLPALGTMVAEPTLLGPLTRRETELITLMASGLSNRQLADRINLSLATVKWHQQNLYAKLNVSGRHAALAHARALNLLPG